MFILLLIYFSLFIEILLADNEYGIELGLSPKSISINKSGITPKISNASDGILYFEIKPNDENSLFNVTFYSGSNPNNSIIERYLNLKKPLIYIDSKISSINNYRMLINCSSDCNYNLFYQILNHAILKDNSNFSLYYKDRISNKTIYYKPEIPDLNSNNILINVMGKSIEDFPISFYYGNQTIKSEKNFINGKGLLITKDSGITLDSTKNFSIEYIPLINDFITFSSRIINLTENIPTTEIDLLSETYVVLNKNFSKECFSVKSDFKDIIYLNAFSKQGVNVYHVNSSNYSHIFTKKKIINSDYFLFNLNLSKVFCFNSTDENLPSSTVDFQIFFQDKIMDNMDILTPILRGVEYKFFLENSTMIYHRLASINKNVKYTSSSDFYVKLKLLKGNIDFYQGNCTYFPNCFIDKETLNPTDDNYKLSLISNVIEDGINIGEANFNLSSLKYYSIIYFSNYQILPTVKCNIENEEENCEYTIQIMNKIDDLRYTQTSYGKNIYKNYDYINSYSSKVCYAFNVDDENITSIKVELNSLQGNSDLKTYSDSQFTNSIGNYYSLGNKEYIIIDKNEKENLINQYYYCMKYMTNAYSISKVILKSKNETNDYISEGETEINSINFKEKSKNFIVVKQNISNSYFIFIKAINCKLNISYNNNKVSSRSAQFLDYDYTKEESNLTISLDSLDSGRSNENENCIFYTGFSDITKPIQINEGISYDLTLSTNLKKMLFRYDFYLNKAKILIFIDKYNTGTLKITVHSANSKEYYLTDFNNFKAIDIDVKDITAGNNLNHSVIFIDIEYYEEIETDINYSLEIFYSEDKSPYYLPEGELILDIFEGTQYFYTDIKKNKYAEIVINSKIYPLNKLYGKIINKNQNEKYSNWNNYVELPTTNSLTYDYYNRKFIIYENDTENCDVEFGCELYIGIKSSQSKFSEYSIFLRYNDTIVKVPNDEYLFGSLEINDEEKQYDYYSYTVTKNINKFLIIFDTELCEIYINEGKEKPSNIKYKYKIGSDVHSFEISSENSLINKVYTIAVTPKELNGNYKSYYRFKIVEQSNEQIIYFIESQSEEFCEIENDGENCFYILKYNPNNDIYNFYARNLLYMETNIINIKAKVVNAKDFELSNNKLSYFYEDDFIYNNTLNGYLNFSKDSNFNEDQFILIKLTSEHKGKISLTSQFYPIESTDYLNPNYYKLFSYIGNTISNKIIKFDGNETYSIRFQFINGSKISLIQNNSNYEIELNSEEQNNIILVDRIIGKSYESNTFKIPKTYFYYTLIGKYTQRTSDKNFDIIEYGNPNYFTYFNSYNDIFPIIFYLPVFHSNKNVTIYVNITNNISSIEDFNVEVYGILTDSVSVMKAKRNLNTEFNIGANSECEFDYDENNAVFEFNAKDIENFNVNDTKYFYIKLDASNDVYNLPNISLIVDTELSKEEEISSSSKSASTSKSNSKSSSSSNKSTSNSKSKSSSSSSKEKDNSSSDSSSYEEDSVIIENPVNVEPKSYFNSILKNNEINSFLLKFYEKMTSKIKIELSYPQDEFSISFRAYKDSSTKSYLIKDDNINKIDSNGKTNYLIYEVTNYLGIFIQLSPKNNKNRNYRKIDDNNSELFTVKYIEYSNDDVIIYFNFTNDSISSSSTDDNYIWSVGQINSSSDFNYDDVKYSLNLYDSKDYSSISILDSISSMEPNYTFSNYSLENSSKKVIFTINKNDISNEISIYYINIIANVTYNNDYELLSANPISFKLISFNNEEESSSSEDSEKKSTVLIICLVILIVIIISIVIFVFYNLKIKNKHSTPHEKFDNEKYEHNNLNTEQKCININEKPDYKNLEMNNIEHPVDIE